MQPAKDAGAGWFPYKSAHLLSRPHVRKIASVDCGEHIKLVFSEDELYRNAPNGMTLFRGTKLLNEVVGLLGSESDDWIQKFVVVYIDKSGSVHFGKPKQDTDARTIEYTYDIDAEPGIYERIEKVVSGFDFIDSVSALLPCGSYVYPDKDMLDATPENSRTSAEWSRRETGWMKWNPKVPGSGKHWQQQPCTGKGADRWIASQRNGLRRTIGWMPSLWGCAVIDIDVNDHADASDEDRQQIGDHRLQDTLDSIGVDPAGVIPSNSPGGWHIIVRSDQEEPSGIHEFGEIRCSSGQAVIWHPNQLLEALKNIPECESINWREFLDKRPAKHYEITDPNHPNKKVRSTGMALRCNTAEEYKEALIDAPSTNRHDIGRSTCSSAFIKLGVSDEVRNALQIGLSQGPFGTKYDTKEIERTLRDSARFASSRIKEKQCNQMSLQFEQFKRQVEMYKRTS